MNYLLNQHAFRSVTEMSYPLSNILSPIVTLVSIQIFLYSTQDFLKLYMLLE